MIYWIVLVVLNGVPWEVAGIYKSMAKAKRHQAGIKKHLKGTKGIMVSVVGSSSDAVINLEE